eukprot:gene26145-11867_t
MKPVSPREELCTYLAAYLSSDKDVLSNATNKGLSPFSCSTPQERLLSPDGAKLLSFTACAYGNSSCNGGEALWIVPSLQSQVMSLSTVQADSRLFTEPLPAPGQASPPGSKTPDRRDEFVCMVVTVEPGAGVPIQARALCPGLAQYLSTDEQILKWAPNKTAFLTLPGVRSEPNSGAGKRRMATVLVRLPPGASGGPNKPRVYTSSYVPSLKLRVYTSSYVPGLKPRVYTSSYDKASAWMRDETLEGVITMTSSGVITMTSSA